MKHASTVFPGIEEKLASFGYSIWIIIIARQHFRYVKHASTVFPGMGKKLTCFGYLASFPVGTIGFVLEGADAPFSGTTVIFMGVHESATTGTEK